MIFAEWERVFGVEGGSFMNECSKFVFKEIKKKLRNKNRVSKQRFFCFRFPLCPLSCFLTGYYRG